MKKEKIMQKLAVCIVLLAALAFMGCGGEAEKNKDEVTSGQETVVTGEDEEEMGNETENEADKEETAEPEERPVEEMTTEEWIDSLTFDEGKFIVFNEDTGKREVLENGQEYVISETDTLALWKPKNWEYGSIYSAVSEMSIKFGTKYGYLTVDFNYDGVGEKTEVWTTFKDSNGNEVVVNIYLTREETSVGETESDLSNEEWVKSLNLEKPTFLVFNDTTGERKVLEDGQEYMISETDVLAFWWPSESDWTFEETKDSSSLINGFIKKQYGCSIESLDYDKIVEKSEFAKYLKDPAGNEVSVTVYLTKAKPTE